MGQTQKKWTDEELDEGEELYDDYEHYAEEALKIKPKDKNTPGIVKGVIPLKFNTAQRYLQWRLKKQWEAIGRTRAFVLKGRQQGCSTWIEGLYFHETTLNYGIKTFIQTHSKKATKNLYRMAHRFLDNLPLDLKPHVGVSNTDDLVFDELDSGYTVSTAGSAEAGRSDTIDKLHGSEVAFWKSTLDHTAGLLQAVPDVPGSRVVFESTANGMGGYFHKGYTSAQAGTNGDYIAVFIPWYWQEEYRKPVPKGFALTEDELKYVDLYDRFIEFDVNGDVTYITRKIDLEQMVWRRDKIAEFEGSIAKFNQEYPATPEMAFQFSNVESFISAESVIKALKRPQYTSRGAVIAGFDSAFRSDEDNNNNQTKYRKAFMLRQRANAWGLEYPKLNGYRAKLGYLKKKLDATTPYIDFLFIDAGGGGYDLYSSLIEDGYNDVYERVRIVNSGTAAEDNEKYANRRAEMTDRLKKALGNEDMPLSINVDEEVRDAFIVDLTAEGATEDHLERLLIEKKEKVQIRLGLSPEAKDALGLTYAETVKREHVQGSHNSNCVIETDPLYFE